MRTIARSKARGKSAPVIVIVVIRSLISAASLISQKSPAASHSDIFPNDPITALTTIHIYASRRNFSQS